MFDEKQHYLNSSLRENIIEHLFVGTALQNLWRQGRTDVEILRSEFDAYGYDLVISSGKMVRHVQLKSGTTLKKVSVSDDLARKPSGCVIFIMIDNTLNMGPFYMFGGEAGSPLPETSELKQTKRTTPNSDGKKPVRLKHRDVPAKSFKKYDDLSALLQSLLGAEAVATSDER